MTYRSPKCFCSCSHYGGIFSLGIECGSTRRTSEQDRSSLGFCGKKLEAACHDTLAKYCGTVTPGEGRLLLCLAAHEDKIDSKCDYALYDASRNLEGALDRIEQAADACWHDIETHCADLPAGEGHIAQCLMHKRASLSPPCQHELEKFAK
jgi:Golgi apparatus protein 1